MRKEKKVLPQFKGIDPSLIRPISNLFLDKEFFVFSNDPKLKNELEIKIVRHGGIPVQNPTSKTDFILADDDKTIRVKNFIDASKKGQNPYGDKDVYKMKWLLSSIEKQKVLPPHPSLLYYASEKTKNYFDNVLDNYLNSNQEEDNEESFQLSVQEVKKKHTYFDITKNQINQINSRFGIKTNQFLNGVHFYLKEKNAILSLGVQLYGGIVDKSKTNQTDYVISKNPLGDEMSQEWLEDVLMYKKL